MEKKILDLLTKAGCKPELVNAIGESLVAYKQTISEQFEADYTTKVEQAKKICIEETEAHKRDLARRLQVFLETKGAAIDAHRQRQAALNESDAVTKLKSLKALLEGIQVEHNGSANGQLPAIIEKAKRQLKQLAEERDRALAVANKQNAIAEKVLTRNRALVRENAQLKTKAVARPVAEGQTGRTAQRIDQTRRTVQPATSRPTLVENQDRRPAARSAGGQTTNVANRPVNVADIATVMDEDLI